MDTLFAAMNERLTEEIRPFFVRATPAQSDATEAPAEKPAATSGDLIDWTVALASVENNEEILTIVVDAALQEVPDMLDQIENALQTSDAATIQRCAHNIKSTARTLGAASPGELALTLEKLAGEGQIDQIREQSPAFTSLVKQMLTELKQR